MRVKVDLRGDLARQVTAASLGNGGTVELPEDASVGALAAARAGVTQSVISAYESGQRQPSIPAPARLIGATGFELTLGLRKPPGRPSRLSGPVGRRIRRYRQDLVAVAAAHGVSNLRVFGSVARGEDRSDSDVGLLADFSPGLSLFGLGRLQDRLEAILGTGVDLIPAADLKPGVRDRVEPDLIAL